MLIKLQIIIWFGNITFSAIEGSLIIDQAMIQHVDEVDEGCSTSSAVHSYEPAGNKRTRLTTQMELGGAKSKTTGRNYFVLPKICLICKKNQITSTHAKYVS